MTGKYVEATCMCPSLHFHCFLPRNAPIPSPCCRRDAVEALDVGQVQRRGGGGCILAERMLPEVAYKLGRAPKYGA